MKTLSNRFGLVQGFPLENLDATVGQAFAAATERLERAGVRVTRETISLLDDMRQVNAYGGIVQPEACAIHRDRLKRRSADIDPNVRPRLERGATISAADYVDTVLARTRLAAAMDLRLAQFDALTLPTSPIIAPTIAEIADPKTYIARNLMLLRNTSPVNFCELCAISLPLPAALPVGLMLVARNGQDHALLRIAAAVEQLLAS